MADLPYVRYITDKPSNKIDSMLCMLISNVKAELFFENSVESFKNGQRINLNISIFFIRFFLS